MLIYKITNTVNGKIYVGKWHGKSAKSRWAMHVAHAKSFTSGKKHYFHSAIRKHGPSAFVIEEIAYAETPTELAKLEMLYISELGSYRPSIGYNQTMGGEGEAWTEERRQRSSVERKARKQKMSPQAKENMRQAKLGEKNPFFGKTHTPENVAKMGATRKGSHNSPEHCEAISRGVSGQKNGMYGKTPWLGKQHTQASRKKMSTTRKEMYASDSSLSVRISEEMKRNWGNPKVRRKMLAGARRGSKMSSMTQFGHPVSEETKRKISEAAKARHAARRQADHDRKDVRNGGPMMVVPPMYPNATF
jgi:group I intron endonuclease